jgi:hypothetical protein
VTDFNKEIYIFFPLALHTIPASQRTKVLHVLNRSATVTGPTNIVRMTKLRKMRWRGHIACVGENRRWSVYGVWQKNQKRIDQEEDKHKEK